MQFSSKEQSELVGKHFRLTCIGVAAWPVERTLGAVVVVVTASPATSVAAALMTAAAATAVVLLVEGSLVWSAAARHDSLVRLEVVEGRGISAEQRDNIDKLDVLKYFPKLFAS